MGFLHGIFGGSRRRAAVRSAIAAVEGAGGLDAALSALAPLPARDRAEAVCLVADDRLSAVFEALQGSSPC